MECAVKGEGERRRYFEKAEEGILKMYSIFQTRLEFLDESTVQIEHIL